MTSAAPQTSTQTPTQAPVAARAPATGRLARVTLLAPRCRADLVLPAEEPVGVLLPEILTLVGLGPTGSPRGYQMSTLTGRVLEPSVSLRAAGVADGALLRVDPLSEAPPAAVLTDVSDELADDLSRRRGRWGKPARQWTATVTVTLAVLLAALLAAPHLPAAALTLLGLLLLLGGATIALFGPADLGVTTLLAGTAVAMAAVPCWTGSWPGRCVLWTLGGAVCVLVLGVVSGHHRVGAFGSGSLVVALVLWGGLPALGLPPDTTATIMAVVSVAALGLLPRLALLASGLARLDDRCLTGQPVPRVAAAAAVDAAHRGLAVACVAAASSGALAGWALAQHGTGWTITLACLLTLAMLLRVRAYPLTVEVVSLLAASLLVIASLAHRLLQLHPARWEGAVALMLAVALTGLVVLGYQPQPHVRVRARQLADRLEGVVVVALIPVAVGACGVFSTLGHTF
ncbi:MAG: type VII secretion integral membrane protein EccD [Pseudonocardiales bacterium]|nr:type VII secretion integral membrane protein EccD [Pseudonocardiales bacterium]